MCEHTSEFSESLKIHVHVLVGQHFWLCSLNFLFQIDRQLSAYMRRVEDVLGKGWENHVEGQRLKADGDSFRQKLNTQELFDEWSRKVGTVKQVIKS